jgi:phosphosulfolactate synthase (CoM biosynthesis protein A)
MQDQIFRVQVPLAGPKRSEFLQFLKNLGFPFSEESKSTDTVDLKERKKLIQELESENGQEDSEEWIRLIKSSKTHAELKPI